MGKEIITFSYTEIEKPKFRCYKSPIFRRYRYRKHTSIYQDFFEKNYKCFIGYLYNDYKTKSSCMAFRKQVRK